MNHADIKVGKYYNLQLMCILNKEKVIVFGSASGDHIPMRQCDLECVTPIPSEPPTLVGPTPKHDPCRMCANFNGRTCGEHGGITRNPRRRALKCRFFESCVTYAKKLFRSLFGN